MLSNLFKFLGVLVSIPLLILILFNMGGGVDCKKYSDSGSCFIGNNLSKLFYFPECKDEMAKYNQNKEKTEELRREGKLNQSNTGPFSQYPVDPLSPIKCGIHNYFFYSRGYESSQGTGNSCGADLQLTHPVQHAVQGAIHQDRRDQLRQG